MEYTIYRNWAGSLKKYKNVLDNYGATYHSENDDYYAIINLTSLDDLLVLPKQLDENIIISRCRDELIIDDYTE